jgi:redox-sensitive bicupin YhaK (pirin superfamily)
MRQLKQVVTATPSSDGDGVRIHRLAGSGLRTYLNPFLMIDEINSDEAADYIGGFPMHPHRGFETITYMKAGRMRHRDHMGNEGVIGPGDVQWMTAGAGVMHSEMPEQEAGLLHGFQLWLNLPGKEKMKPAAYRDIAAAEIESREFGGGRRVSVIAGEVEIDGQALTGPIRDISTQPVFLDVDLAAHTHIEIELPSENRVLVYLYQGSTDQLRRRELGVYTPGSILPLTSGSEGARALVLSGQPINEPVVQHGPFVMNTQQQIEQAISDYQNNQLVNAHR